MTEQPPLFDDVDPRPLPPADYPSPFEDPEDDEDDDFEDSPTHGGFSEPGEDPALLDKELE